jgi:hypothetical protein
MGPRTKYEDTIYEKVEYSGKMFMYNSKTWDVLFPIVNIIRLFRENTIISYSHGKNQQTIRTYGTQYNHRVVSCDLIKREDYLFNLKTVKCIFLFSDCQDTTFTNIMNVATKNNINIVCYSNIDSVYHFYENGKKETMKTAELVIEKMYKSMELKQATKYAELFPDFELLEPEIDKTHSTLEQCAELLKGVHIEEKKKKEQKVSKLFDPHMNKLKRMEYERSQKNIVYPDSVEELMKKQANTSKSLLARFFSKPKV